MCVRWAGLHGRHGRAACTRAWAHPPCGSPVVVRVLCVDGEVVRGHLVPPRQDAAAGRGEAGRLEPCQAQHPASQATSQPARTPTRPHSVRGLTRAACPSPWSPGRRSKLSGRPCRSLWLRGPTGSRCSQPGRTCWPARWPGCTQARVRAPRALLGARLPCCRAGRLLLHLAGCCWPQQFGSWEGSACTVLPP